MTFNFDMTIMMFINIDNLDNQMALVSQTANISALPAPLALFITSDGRLIFGRGDGVSEASQVSDTNLTPFVGSWIHITVVQKDSEVTFYLNGIFDGSGSVNTEIIDDTGLDLTIGARSFTNGTPYHGHIDEFKMFNRSLSSNEIRTYLGLDLLWTPANIETAIWLDASDVSTITESSGSVSQWDDKSGNGNDATQAVSVEQPTTGTRTINSLNTIDFDGTTDSFTLNSSFDMIGKAVFVVIETDDLSLTQIVFSETSTNVQLRINAVSGLLNYAAASPYWIGISTEPITASIPSVIGWIGDTDISFVVDGVHDEPNGGSGGGSSAIFDAIGKRANSNTEFTNGKIGEIIVIPSIPTQVERQKIEGHLAWKWGQESSLPIGHPYKTAPPTI
jgi:hypothetical protein